MLPDLREALRYSGIPSPTEDMLSHMEQLAREAEPRLHPKAAWKCFDLRHTEEGVWLQGTDMLLTGKLAGAMLKDCDKAAAMVCTIGPGFDTLLRTVSARNMSDALLMNGLGGAWVEQYCNDTEQQIRDALPGYYLTDRFSPGYGDLPLSLQAQLLNALNAVRRCGVTLLPSQLMIPEKTVTAIVGLSDRPQQARIRGCRYCAMSKTCTLKKGGHTCAV